MAQSEDKMQIIIVHGGDSFSSYDEFLTNLKNSALDYDRLLPSKHWVDAVTESLNAADVLTPRFPNKQNADFEEWKIYFEKLIPFFGSDVRLVGHSLGAMFLAKYLHESPLSSPVRQLILLAGGYDNPDADYGSFKLDSAAGLERSAHKIHLLHSRDDFVVDYSELAKYQADLPSATVHTFTDKNHFLDEDFPELINILKQK